MYVVSGGVYWLLAHPRKAANFFPFFGGRGLLGAWRTSERNGPLCLPGARPERRLIPRGSCCGEPQLRALTLDHMGVQRCKASRGCFARGFLRGRRLPEDSDRARVRRGARCRGSRRSEAGLRAARTISSRIFRGGVCERAWREKRINRLSKRGAPRQLEAARMHRSRSC